MFTRTLVADPAGPVVCALEKSSKGRRLSDADLTYEDADSSILNEGGEFTSQFLSLGIIQQILRGDSTPKNSALETVKFAITGTSHYRPPFAATMAAWTLVR